jgi:hypothetical protein
MEQKTAIDQKATRMFGTPNGQIVDVLYITSAGNPHFTPEEAMKEASDLKLLDRTVTPYYRDSTIRMFAEKNPFLKKTMFAIDYLKMQSFLRRKPSYEEYVVKATNAGQEIADGELYEFLQRRSFMSRLPVQCGQQGEIYIPERGICKATFMRRITSPSTLIWQVGDEPVLTTLFNVALLTSHYKDIFAPVLKTA